MKLLGCIVTDYQADRSNWVTVITLNPPSAQMAALFEEANWDIGIQPIAVTHDDTTIYHTTFKRGAREDMTVYPE